MSEREAIRARWAKATPQPWRVKHQWNVIGANGRSIVTNAHNTNIDEERANTESEANISAIAHAPTDIAWYDAALTAAEARAEALAAALTELLWPTEKPDWGGADVFACDNADCTELWCKRVQQARRALAGEGGA